MINKMIADTYTNYILLQQGDVDGMAEMCLKWCMR